MNLNTKKWFAARIAFCLAILLAFQPFIHAHIDADHAAQNHGFHVGAEHEEAFNIEHSTNHTLSDAPHASHIVSVDSDIRKDIDTTLLPDTIAAILLSFFFVLALQSAQRLNAVLLLTPKESLKRRLPASRAPPTL